MREVLAVIERAGMISFAGGLPAPETFPDLDLAALPRSCLQYGPTEGEAQLRSAIAERLGALGLVCSPEQVLILSGSQQGIDLAAKLFIDSGTPVAVESPTYLAALQAFRFFGAALEVLRIGEPCAGMDGEAPPAFVYAIPTFQNPTGHCYTAGERAALAAACDRLAVPLFEDDPYRDLAYEPCERTPVCAQLKRAPWIYQSSFSKCFAPGLRLGFLAASPDLMPLLVRLKQAADLHSSRISQWLALELLRNPDTPERLRANVAVYRRRRDEFAAALGRHFGGLAAWHTPPGGLFFWLRLCEPLDTRQLFTPAIDAGVAFMPGELFHPGRPAASGTLRLNFSHATAAEADRGLAILADLLRRAICSGAGRVRPR
ncbi:MAG: PLP-dependent aminotransferase family protein [Steroidobacteraceae bacterium]